jgi:hypothetical protein
MYPKLAGRIDAPTGHAEADAGGPRVTGRRSFDTPGRTPKRGVSFFLCVVVRLGGEQRQITVGR